MGGGPSRSQGGLGLEEARQHVDSAAGAGPCAVQVAATEILRIAGVPAYHTSVILGNKEYYFDSQGIISAPALWSHFIGASKRPREFKTEVINYGPGSHSGVQLTQSLQSFFEKGSYDVLHKNCNIFTDAALYYLTRRRLDGRFNRLERLLVATEPFSTEVLNRILMADPATAQPSGEPSPGRLWPGPYAVNPQAQHFSVEQVIMACDVMNAVEVGGHSTLSGVCGCVLDGWNCSGAGGAEDVLPSGEDGPGAAVTVQSSDVVDVDETVTRVAALLPLLTPEDTPGRGQRIDSEEDFHYWDFELDLPSEDGQARQSWERLHGLDLEFDDGEEQAACGRGGIQRTVPLHEIVGEAWEVHPPGQEELSRHPPRRCPTWSACCPPRHGASLDGASELPSSGEVRELPAEGPVGLEGARCTTAPRPPPSREAPAG